LDQYLERIQVEHPQALRSADEPDFRYALYSAQKAAARSGDENLQDVLVELLVDRGKQAQRSLTQLVLNETIEVVPRITTGQMNVLTLAVIFHRIAFPGVSTFDTFLRTMDIFLVPFLDDLPTSFGSINHLVYAGCGASHVNNTKMADAISRQYPGIFSFGFSDADVRIKGLGAAARGMLIPCDHNPALVQVMGGTKAMFKDICNQKNIPERDREMLEGVFLGSPLPHAVIRNKCLAARPYFAKVFDAWDATDLMGFVPSNVGLAIAHARLSKCGQIEPLSSWIE
jgi:hypothetical protein